MRRVNCIHLFSLSGLASYRMVSCRIASHRLSLCCLSFPNGFSFLKNRSIPFSTEKFFFSRKKANTLSWAEKYFHQPQITRYTRRAFIFSFQFYLFSYELGKGPARIISDQQVKMNQWNQLQVHREGIKGYLVLNGRRLTGSSKAGLTQLNLRTYMYLGGGVQGVPEK